MHTKNILTAGKSLDQARKVLILVHGRGGNARDILSLADVLDVTDFALLAPQASDNTWYPYSFMAAPARNEPWLSSALGLLKEVVSGVTDKGIAAENIYFAGFSQGACLMLEFITRNATRFGGAAAFTGGLIGDKIYQENYAGDFRGTPVFIGSGNPDPHVPVERIHKTTAILKGMNAAVTAKIYDNRPHTISQDEITLANKLVFTRSE